MLGVVENIRGTAKRIASEHYRIAGKTGAAQVFSVKQDEEYEEKKKKNIPKTKQGRTNNNKGCRSYKAESPQRSCADLLDLWHSVNASTLGASNSFADPDRCWLRAGVVVSAGGLQPQSTCGAET